MAGMSDKKRLAIAVAAGLLVLLLVGHRTVRWFMERAPRREIARHLVDLEAAGLSLELEDVVAASPRPEGDLLAALDAIPWEEDAAEAFLEVELHAGFGRVVGPGRLVMGDPERVKDEVARLERWARRAVPAARRALAARGPAVALDERGQLAEVPTTEFGSLLGVAVSTLEVEWGLAVLAGRSDAAWASIADIGKLLGRVQWPTVIGRLTVDAQRRVLVDRVAITLWRCGPPPDAAAHRRRLERLEDLEGLALASRGELARLLWMSRRLVEDGPSAVPELEDTPLHVELLLPRPALLRDQAALLRSYGPVVRAAATGRLEELFTVARDAEAAIRASFFDEPLLITHLFGGSPSRQAEHLLRTIALLRMARAALALGVAAGDGDLPQALPPDAALPDPFASPPAPLRWRRTGPRSGLLWSVGPEGQDDGRDLPDLDDLDDEARARLPEWARGQVVRLEVRLPEGGR